MHACDSFCRFAGERIALAEEAKREGNGLFKAGNYADAKKQYDMVMIPAA